MKSASIPDRTSRFFLVIGVVGVLVIFIGFSKPFFIPLAHKTFKAPLSIYVHAVFSFGWVLLFTIQAFLVQTNRLKYHINLGLAGIAVAVGATLSLIPVGKFIVERDLQAGLGENAYSNSVGLLTTGAMFLTLVGFGILYRRDRMLHKRLILLSTIVLLWPAWFRFRHFFPGIPRPDIWFAVVLADSLIVVSWIWDKYRNKGIHPVLLYVGMTIILEQTLEVFLYDTAPWRTVGKVLYNLF